MKVFITYGRQSNDRLLQYYGFVEGSNPFDSYDFNQDILDLLLQSGDALPAPPCASVSGGVERRLEQLTYALQRTDVQVCFHLFLSLSLFSFFSPPLSFLIFFLL